MMLISAIPVFAQDLTREESNQIETAIDNFLESTNGIKNASRSLEKKELRRYQSLFLSNAVIDDYRICGSNFGASGYWEYLSELPAWYGSDKIILPPSSRRGVINTISTNKKNLELVVDIESNTVFVNSHEVLSKSRVKLTLRLMNGFQRLVIEKLEILNFSTKFKKRTKSESPSLSFALFGVLSEEIRVPVTYSADHLNSSRLLSTGLRLTYCPNFLKMKLAKKLSIQPVLGLGFTYNSLSLKIDKFNSVYDELDFENDHYLRIIEGASLEESLNIIDLEFLLRGKLSYKASEKVSSSLSFGISFSRNFSSSYSGQGIFTYKGYYPQYSTTIEDIPEFDFISDVDVQGTPKLDRGLMNYHFEFEPSISIIGENIDLDIGLLIRVRQLLKEEADDLPISSNALRYDGSLSFKKKTTINSLGLIFSIRMKKRWRNGVIEEHCNNG